MAMFSILKTIMQSLVSKSATRSYPMEPKKTFQDSRGHIDIDIERCIFCGICQRKCPTRAIVVDKNEKTWQIARYDCMQCNSCADLCPKKCLQMEPGLPEAMNQQVEHLVRLADKQGREE